MQIVPAKINIKDDIVSAQGYAILDVKDRVEALRMDLLAENSNLCSGMSGDIKRYFANAGEYTISNIEKVNNTFVELAGEIEMLVTRMNTMDEQASYTAGGGVYE